MIVVVDGLVAAVRHGVEQPGVGVIHDHGAAQLEEGARLGPVAVVHGDPSPDNLRLADGQVGFLDWDEARVDAAVLDLAALPLDLSVSLGAERWAAACRAVDAWEVANAWQAEPDYARKRLARL